MIVAGEASGDKHGASLIRALIAIAPSRNLEFFGAGGDEMRAAGAETLVDAKDMAVIGVPEILAALGRFYRAYRRLAKAALQRRPDAAVLIDWPDFNLRLARRLHRQGIRVVYYISPQVWAWRRYRVRALRRDVDRMLVILPFEEAFYRESGIEAEYVGHPLAGAVRVTASREEFCAGNGLDATRPIVALLPGSRIKEVEYHLPLMLDAASRLASLDVEAFPEAGFAASGRPQFVVPLAGTVNAEQAEAILGSRRTEKSETVKLIRNDTYNALGHASMAVVASGTATVEAALLGTPMVIIYRASLINWWLIRPLIALDTFGMVNLIAGERIVPELIQHAATGERIADEARRLLTDAEAVREMKRGLATVRKRLELGGSEGPRRAAQAVLEAI